MRCTEWCGTLTRRRTAAALHSPAVTLAAPVRGRPILLNSRSGAGVAPLSTLDANQCKRRWYSALVNREPRRAEMLMTKLVTKLGLVVAALFLSSVLAGHAANAAGGCGAGLYRDVHGICHFYRAEVSARHVCSVGFVWRNGRCRQNVGNDPFVSTWPNAPR